VLGCPRGVVRGCDPEGAALMNYLYAGYWTEAFSFSLGIALIGISFMDVLVVALRAKECFIPVDS
jgi:hypothetical protein